MKTIAILGSGFGLYGYLPALASIGLQIILPERYKSRFDSRPELTTFRNHIRWEKTEIHALDQASGMLLSLPPRQQYELLSANINRQNINEIILEKPLAISPEAASDLFENLIKSKKKFRIAYLFRYTSWGNYLLSQLKNNENIKSVTLKWHFMAHHFQHNIITWKRFHSLGGGVIRFYGIHLIALLAEIGYRQVTLSEVIAGTSEEPESWQALFVADKLPNFNIIIRSRSQDNLFQILTNTSLTHSSDPFDGTENNKTSLDRRVPILKKLYLSLNDPNETQYPWYSNVIKLWSAVEKQLGV